MFDVAGAFVEFGLKEVAIAEEVVWQKDVQTEQVHFANGSSAVTQTGCSYEGFLKIDRNDEIQSWFHGDKTRETVDITLTGIKDPREVTLENAIVTKVQSGFDEATEIDFIAESITEKKFW